MALVRRRIRHECGGLSGGKDDAVPEGTWFVERAGANFGIVINYARLWLMFELGIIKVLSEEEMMRYTRMVVFIRPQAHYFDSNIWLRKQTQRHFYIFGGSFGHTERPSTEITQQFFLGHLNGELSPSTRKRPSRVGFRDHGPWRTLLTSKT